jgi:gamma-glutamyltranspeptidase/glutathione hydrolase
MRARSLPWIFGLGVLLSMNCSAERLTPQAGRTGRSMVVAPHGMVCAAHPLAAQIGLDVLKRGGNAIDAAIATNAALGLMEPMSCGVGGDLFALVWDAKTQKLYGLNASGRIPYRATQEWFAEHGHKSIPTTGPLSWSVPGCVDGWDTLLKRFGSRPLGELLEPSIRYAEEGFPVPEVIAGYWRGAASRLRQDPASAKTFLVNGEPPQAGDLFKNPYLAATYRELAKGGREAYYRGRIAREIVQASDQHGGLFSLKDFEDHTSTWTDPLSANYRGYDVWELPPPGQGIAALQMLNLLEGFDLQSMGPESPEYWHLFIEAKKLAFADRARHYADPEFQKVPVAELISQGYAEERRKLIDPSKAATQVEHGDPKLSQSETTYLCVVDKDRNCVSLIQSNYMGFGSGITPGDLGFGLQNRGTLLALDPKHANRLEPHKRPFHTIIPAMVTKGGKPWLVFGVMGGDMQPQGHVEVLCNLIDFGMNPQAAGEAPRIEHVGSASPKGAPARGGGTVQVEAGFSKATIEELERRGHHVVTVRTNGGGYQAIMLRPNGALLGATEARKDGCAVGY